MMKARILSLVIALVALVGMGKAQSEFFNRILEMPGITSVYISPKMFQMMKGAELGEPAMNQLVGKMEMMLLISAETPEAIEMLGKEMSEVKPENGYEYLLKVKDGQDGVNILMKEGKKTNEYVMWVIEKGEDGKEIAATAIVLEGSFTLEEVQQVMNVM